MEHIDLTAEQRLYLRTIIDYFRQNSQWPTYHYLDQTFDYPDLDIEEIWNSLPPGLTNCMDLSQLENKAMLTVPGLYVLEPDASELATFLSVVKFCVDAYTHLSDDKPEVSSKSIHQYHPRWRVQGISQAGYLLSVETVDIWSTFDGPDPYGQWRCFLTRGIKRFRGITTI